MLRHMKLLQTSLKKHLPITGSDRALQMFVHTFHNHIVSFVGAGTIQAEMLGLSPTGAAYRRWIRDSLLKFFQPWLAELILPLPQKGD